MKMIIKKIFGRLFDKPRKFFPIVDACGLDKPRKFFPITETEYLVIQRYKGCYGNGRCTEQDF